MLEKLARSPGRSDSAADLYDWDDLVQEDRVHRLIYTDPAIFEAEMTHVFGAVWVYVGHESQIAKPNDYITTKLGLRPIILLRDSNGKIRALFNRCTHRGTTLCRLEKGSAFMFVCPYHGWSFLNTGKLRAVPWPDGYACDFKDEKFNVAQVPRVESYRGFIFATLNLDAPPLLDYLGAITQPIDEWLDRQPQGQGRGLRSEPAQVQEATGSSPTTIPATAITSCSRTARSLEMENPARRRGQQGHVVLQGLADIRRRCTWPIWATAITSRTSGRTSRSAPAACGQSKVRRLARSIIKKSCAAVTAPGPRTFSTSRRPSR